MQQLAILFAQQRGSVDAVDSVGLMLMVFYFSLVMLGIAGM